VPVSSLACVHLLLLPMTDEYRMRDLGPRRMRSLSLGDEEFVTISRQNLAAVLPVGGILWRAGSNAL
jgi:hypothetical protein